MDYFQIYLSDFPTYVIKKLRYLPVERCVLCVLMVLVEECSFKSRQTSYYLIVTNVVFYHSAWKYISLLKMQSTS